MNTFIVQSSTSEESHEVSTTRPTIIEVWQKRPKVNFKKIAF